LKHIEIRNHTDHPIIVSACRATDGKPFIHIGTIDHTVADKQGTHTVTNITIEANGHKIIPINNVYHGE
jgi:hypothetical protein